MSNETVLAQINEILLANDSGTQKLKSFMDSYGDSLFALQFYLKYNNNCQIMNFVNSSLSINRFSDLVSSLYCDAIIAKEFQSYFGLNSNEDDIYLKFFNLMKDNFEIGQNIVEIGCGWFPSLARYIDNEQQRLGRGSIICYDPRLKIHEFGNIILNQGYLYSDTDVSKAGLICSFYVCDAERELLEVTEREKKEFIMGICTCYKFYPYDFADVMNTCSSPELRKMYLNCLENLSECELKIINDVCNKKLKPSSLYILGDTLDYNIYALYLYRKLCLLKKDNTEYKVIMNDSCIPPVITKKYTKKYF